MSLGLFLIGAMFGFCVAFFIAGFVFKDEK